MVTIMTENSRFRGYTAICKARHDIHLMQYSKLEYYIKKSIYATIRETVFHF